MTPSCRLALFLLTHLCAVMLAADGAPPAAALEQASTIAAKGREEQLIPGLSLVVMKGDEVILARGYGVEELERKTPVTEKTVFALGSISKQFVAGVVLQLIEEGRLSLDDPAARHLPEFTNLPPEVKIRHFLSHTSGMRDENVQPELGALFEKQGTTFAEYVEAARHTPCDWPPGSRWSYGNVNYLMLTLIVERLTGESLEKTVASRLTGPLGWQSIGVCVNPIGDTPGEARGYRLRDGKLLAHEPENISLFRGSGGFCGNALDVARWTRALATGKAFSGESYRRMTTRTRLENGRTAEYGIAMDLGAHDGVPRHGHGGYGGGFSAQAAYYPEAQLTVVVLTNCFIAFPESIERKISRRLLGLPEPVVREVALSGEELQRYAGRYDVGVRGWFVETKVRDGRLWFDLAAPRINLPLVYLGAHEFVSQSPATYRLKFSDEGPARELQLVGMGMMTWYGIRQP